MSEKSLDTASISQVKEAAPITLWGTGVSPYVRKVIVALAEKNIAYEQNEILPKVLLQATGQMVPETFDKISPLGKIPILQIGDFAIADSAVIIAYLDKKFTSGNPLYPDNPEAFARTLWFERYSDTALADVIHRKLFAELVVKPKVLNQQPDLVLVDQTKKHELPLVMDYLNQAVKQYQWIAGNEFTIADIAITTQLLALKLTGFEFKNNPWDNVNQYFSRVTSRPSFAKIR